jgi:histidinol-phosphate aminotransferase
MINYLRDEILALNSYSVQSANDMLKLDAMESPFMLDDNLKNKWLKKLSTVEINRYPQNHNNLKTVVRELMTIPDDLDLIFGNGSDELIQILLLGLQKNTEVISFSPSFVMYEMVAKWCGLPFKAIDLTDNFTINLEKTLKVIANNKPQIIFIAYPNNPTGNCFDEEAIKKILATNTLVIIDEAYYAYADKSFISEIKNYDNLIVLRTISKIGFAGLRLGVMIAKPGVITEFNKLRMPYNINSLTLTSAEFLLANRNLIAKNAQIIIANRKQMFIELNKINAIRAYTSDANFIYFTCNKVDELFDFLVKNNILIKKLKNALRVNVSTDSENNLFLNTVKEFYASNS